MSGRGRVAGALERGERVEIDVDGERVEAFTGETVATALLASGRRAFHRTARLGAPRGVYCGIGLCFDCLVVVDGVRVRACQTPVAVGMRVDTRSSVAGEGGR
jgi:predicted molibdopterin-dependent oxidoreductase YjgC